MARRRKNKTLRYIKAAIAAVFVLACILITVNESLGKPFLPTWDKLFSDAGLSDDGSTLPTDSLLVEMLDVGNADALLLKSGEHAMLIDAGERGDGDTVLSALRQNGVKQLDYVIATHADSDHIGGMQTVVEGMPVLQYIMAFMPEGHTPTTHTYLQLLQTIDERDVPVTAAKVGSSFSLGEATVEILGPAAQFEDNNNQSVICRVTCGKRHFLFMGDAETDAEKALLASGATLSADVIKVGHHGSGTGTSAKLLEAVHPTYALITCGTGNPYGHPQAGTIERLQRRGVKIYRADLNGSVRLLCDGDRITVTPEKGEAS